MILETFTNLDDSMICLEDDLFGCFLCSCNTSLNSFSKNYWKNVKIIIIIAIVLRPLAAVRNLSLVSTQ